MVRYGVLLQRGDRPSTASWRLKEAIGQLQRSTSNKKQTMLQLTNVFESIRMIATRAVPVVLGRIGSGAAAGPSLAPQFAKKELAVNFAKKNLLKKENSSKIYY